MKQLTILCDLDDVLWEFGQALYKSPNKKYGTSIKEKDVTEWDLSKVFPTLTKEQIFGAVDEDDFWDRVQPSKDSARFISAVLKDGHNLKVVTASHYMSFKSKMERFIELFSPYLRYKDMIVTSDKFLIHGDVLIDDAPHNLTSGDFIKLLRDKPHNRSFNEKEHGIIRIHNLHEAYETISIIAKHEEID